MTSITVVNSYEVLGISNNATTKDINSAYKRLALKHHPDKTGGDNESIDEFRKVRIIWLFLISIPSCSCTLTATSTLPKTNPRHLFCPLSDPTSRRNPP